MSNSNSDYAPSVASRQLQDPAKEHQRVEVIYALPPGVAPAADAEPTLADLLRGGWQHRWRIILPALILGLIGAGLSLLMENSYTYRTVLEIGSTGDGNSPMESPEDVRQKIEGAFIPGLLAAKLDENTETLDRLQSWQGSISVTLPRNANVLTLTSTAPLTEETFHSDMLNRLIGMVVQDHERIMNVARSRLARRIDAAQRDLEAVTDRRRIILRRQTSLEADRELLANRLEVLADSIRQANDNRQQALREISGQAQALTLMMIDSSMQADRNQQAEFQRRLSVSIPVDIAGLDKELADLQRQERDIQDRIALLQLDFDSFRETRAVVPPTRSLRKAGPRRSLIALGAAFFGGFIGLVWAFVLATLSSPLAPRPQAPPESP